MEEVEAAPRHRSARHGHASSDRFSVFFASCAAGAHVEMVAGRTLREWGRRTRARPERTGKRSCDARVRRAACVWTLPTWYLPRMWRVGGCHMLARLPTCHTLDWSANWCAHCTVRLDAECLDALYPCKS